MNSKQFLCGAEKSFPFRVLSGEGLDREVTDPCALVYDGTEGFWSTIKSGRIVIMSLDILESFPPDINPATSCLFLSDCDSCPAGFIDLLAENSIPVIASSMQQELLASRVSGLLRERLEYTVYLQGSMLVYRNIGVLVTGESGAGKSRCCLDLLGAGAKLIADDLVEIKKEEGRLYGKCPAQIKNMIEVKGTGLGDVRTLFGERAVADKASIDIAFEIAADNPGSVPGLEIMGLKIPLKIIKFDCDKPASKYVKVACEERCRDNYR